MEQAIGIVPVERSFSLAFFCFLFLFSPLGRDVGFAGIWLPLAPLALMVCAKTTDTYPIARGYPPPPFSRFFTGLFSLVCTLFSCYLVLFFIFLFPHKFMPSLALLKLLPCPWQPLFSFSLLD